MRIKMVGDIMLGELLENYRGGVRTLVDRGVNPFAFCRDELADADLCVGNLECVVTDVSNKGVFFRDILRAPGRFAAVLKAGGISYVNLANNHASDHGREALEDTVRNLRAKEIQVFGIGTGDSFQEEPLVVTSAELRVGFLGYNLANFSPSRFDRAVERICSAVRSARASVNFLVLSLHWGEEYSDCPPPSLAGVARRFLASGCDLIHGHHSHRMQGTVMLDGKLVAPSLGNFVFDDLRRKNRLTGILTADVARTGLQGFRVRPFYINRKFQPQPCDAVASELDRLNRKATAALASEEGSELGELEKSVAHAVARGHQKNRLRMRVRIMLRLPYYVGHLRTLWNYYRRAGRGEFSLTDC